MPAQKVEIKIKQSLLTLKSLNHRPFSDLEIPRTMPLQRRRDSLFPAVGWTAEQ